MLRRTFVIAPMLVVALAATVLAAPLEPLVRGWEQFFRLDWDVAERRGEPVVYGHIVNEWGVPARSVRLLVDALDPAGNVVAQDLTWVPGVLTPGTRAHFEAPAPAAASSYRVSVFAFDWIQANGDVER
jgi:hypothetical protein